MSASRCKSPVSPFVESPSFESFLLQCIEQSRNSLLYSNAIFLSELLERSGPTEESKTLLGQLHFQKGNYEKVVRLLRRSTSEKSRYLLAMALYKLKRLTEAEKSLILKFCVVSNESLEEETKNSFQETKVKENDKETLLGKVTTFEEYKVSHNIDSKTVNADQKKEEENPFEMKEMGDKINLKENSSPLFKKEKVTERYKIPNRKKESLFK